MKDEDSDEYKKKDLVVPHITIHNLIFNYVLEDVNLCKNV